MVPIRIFTKIMFGVYCLIQVSANGQTTINGYEIKRMAPLVLSMKGDTSNMQVYFYKDMTMYRLSYDFSTAFAVGRIVDGDGSDKQQDDHTLLPEPTPPETRYHYVVFRNSEKQAFDSFPNDNDDFQNSRWGVLDEFSKHLLKDDIDTYIFKSLSKESFRPVNSPRKKKKEKNLTVYEHWKDSLKLATCYLRTTDQWNDPRISMSRGFDSLLGKKLIEMKWVMNKAAFKDCDPDCFPGMEEMEDYYALSMLSPLKNEEELLGYFNGFEQKENGMGK